MGQLQISILSALPPAYPPVSPGRQSTLDTANHRASAAVEALARCTTPATATVWTWTEIAYLTAIPVEDSVMTLMTNMATRGTPSRVPATMIVKALGGDDRGERGDCSIHLTLAKIHDEPGILLHTAWPPLYLEEYGRWFLRVRV